MFLNITEINMHFKFTWKSVHLKNLLKEMKGCKNFQI
jgi:hypothetical protein